MDARQRQSQQPPYERAPIGVLGRIARAKIFSSMHKERVSRVPVALPPRIEQFYTALPPRQRAHACTPPPLPATADVTSASAVADEGSLGSYVMHYNCTSRALSPSPPPQPPQPQPCALTCRASSGACTACATASSASTPTQQRRVVCEMLDLLHDSPEYRALLRQRRKEQLRAQLDHPDAPNVVRIDDSDIPLCTRATTLSQYLRAVVAWRVHEYRHKTSAPAMGAVVYAEEWHMCNNNDNNNIDSSNDGSNDSKTRGKDKAVATVTLPALSRSRSRDKPGRTHNGKRRHGTRSSSSSSSSHRRRSKSRGVVQKMPDASCKLMLQQHPQYKHDEYGDDAPVCYEELKQHPLLLTQARRRARWCGVTLHRVPSEELFGEPTEYECDERNRSDGDNGGGGGGAHVCNTRDEGCRSGGRHGSAATACARDADRHECACAKVDSDGEDDDDDGTATASAMQHRGVHLRDGRYACSNNNNNSNSNNSANVVTSDLLMYKSSCTQLVDAAM